MNGFGERLICLGYQGSHVHEAVNHPIIAGNGARDARLQKPLPIVLPSISHRIALGSNRAQLIAPLRIWSRRGAISCNSLPACAFVNPHYRIEELEGLWLFALERVAAYD